MDDDVVLDVAPPGTDGEECRAVVGVEGRDVLCAAGGRTVVGFLRPQPRDVSCPNGGRAISWGSDANGTGVLEPSEIEGNTYVCAHPRAGRGTKAVVMRTALSLRDGHCPAGGTLVQSGVDRDGNGVLSANEIDRATFACNRFGGPALVATVSVEPELPGARCPAGGQRVAVAHDGEIPRVSYACNGH